MAVAVVRQQGRWRECRADEAVDDYPQSRIRERFRQHLTGAELDVIAKALWPVHTGEAFTSSTGPAPLPDPLGVPR